MTTPIHHAEAATAFVNSSMISMFRLATSFFLPLLALYAASVAVRLTDGAPTPTKAPTNTPTP